MVSFTFLGFLCGCWSLLEKGERGEERGGGEGGEEGGKGGERGGRGGKEEGERGERGNSCSSNSLIFIYTCTTKDLQIAYIHAL